MKLSELVAYRNQLDNFSLVEARTKTEFDISHVEHLIFNTEFCPQDLRDQVKIKHQEIHQSLDMFTNAIDAVKQKVEEEIAAKEKFWLEETFKLYSEAMINDSDEHILNRRPKLSLEEENLLKSRIIGVSNSRQPAMIIQPGLETFIQSMVSFDPLYLVDRNEAMLFPCMLEFPELYQRRLRKYIVDECDSAPILELLPNNQFAVCLAYNFFNFKPISVIERYLSEIFDKLKPGGRLMMTFNDCDNEKAVRLAENYYACYTPGKMVRDIAQRIGYDIYFIMNNNGPTTWIELEKPGTLTTLRGGQALAKIVHKT